eukprot:7187579-Pyramimonas_sp.AAC.1
MLAHNPERTIASRRPIRDAVGNRLEVEEERRSRRATSASEPSNSKQPDTAARTATVGPSSPAPKEGISGRVDQDRSDKPSHAQTSPNKKSTFNTMNTASLTEIIG